MIVLTDPWLEKIKSLLPEMPSQKVKRFVQEYSLRHDEAVLMISERGLSEFFESVVTLGARARMAAGRIATQLLPALKTHGVPGGTGHESLQGQGESQGHPGDY